MKVPYENTVNVCLSDLLNNVISNGGQAIPEDQTIGRKRRFDIKIEYKNVEFIIEASFNKRDAIKDAMKRIEEGLIDTVTLAVYYNPKYFTSARTVNEIKEVLLNYPLEVKVFAYGVDISQTLLEFILNKKAIAREVTKEWISVNVNEFGDLLDSIIEFVVKEDIMSKLVEEIDRKVNDFVDVLEILSKNPKLKQSIIEKLYKVLFSPSEEDEDLIIPNVPDEVILAHTYVSILMASILYESVASQHGLDSIQRLLTMHNDHPILALKDAFTKILEVNYEPVFDLAIALIDILFSLQSYPSIILHLRNLINTAIYAVGNRTILRQDFIGYVYHKITGDIATRKGYATFYTKAPIAYFLAYLAIHTPNDEWSNIDWSSIEDLKKFKICDFACGSGTLLSASYNALLSLYRKICFKKFKIPNLSAFHKNIIENSIWGFDALEYATQTASVVLSLHEPGVALNTMNIYHVPVDGMGSLGSLNFWYANTQLLPIKRRTISEIERKLVVVPMFDLIIMNPPFARTTAPGKKDSRPRIFDFITDQKTFKKLWDKYKQIIESIVSYIRSNLNAKNIIDLYVGEDNVFKPQNIDASKAGASFSFVVLASRYLKKGGRLALVLPKTILEGAAFFLLRALLTSNFHIEYIVLSNEEGNTNFSYSTDFSEILLIAKKLNNDDGMNDSNTYIIIFNKQPTNVLEGILLAKEVLKRITQEKVVKEDSIKILSTEAKIYAIPRRLLEDFVWNISILTDAPGILLELISNIVSGSIFDLKIPMTTITKLREKGINFEIANPRAFRGNEFNSKFTPAEQSQYLILKKASKDVYNTLTLNLAKTESINPKNNQAKEFYKAKAGRILIPEALRFNTAPLIAIMSEKPIISSRAHMIKLDDEKVEKALTVWLNSTFTIAYLRSLFTTVQEEFGHIYGWHIRIIPVPDLANQKVIDELAKVFDKFKSVIWNSLPQQYEEAIKGSNLMRLKFDLAIIKALANAYNQKINENKVKDNLLSIYNNLLNILS